MKVRMVMRCKDARILMTVERSEDLAPDQSFLLGKHLEACTGCRTERAVIHRVADRLSGVAGQMIYSSQPETAALLSRSQQGLRRENHSWKGLALGAVAVGAAVLALTLVA